MFISLASAVFVSGRVEAAGLKVGEVLSDQTITINGQNVKKSATIAWGDVISADNPGNVEIMLYPSVSLRLQSGASVKVLGSLVKTDGKNSKSVLTESALQVLKGKIQGQLLHDEDGRTSLKIIGKKSLSSIRGTTFEISSDDANEVKVFEGEVEVQNLETTELTKVLGDQTLTKPELAKPEIVRGLWARSSADILASHAKEAAKFKKLLDQSVQTSLSGVRGDAKKMFKGIGNPYDQFKKKK